MSRCAIRICSSSLPRRVGQPPAPLPRSSAGKSFDRILKRRVRLPAIQQRDQLLPQLSSLVPQSSPAISDAPLDAARSETRIGSTPLISSSGTGEPPRAASADTRG